MTLQEFIQHSALVAGVLLVIMGAAGLTSTFQGSIKTRLRWIAISILLLVAGTLTAYSTFPRSSASADQLRGTIRDTTGRTKTHRRSLRYAMIAVNITRA